MNIGGLADLLGLDDVLAAPWSDEVPGHLNADALVASFGALRPGELERVTALGFVEADGEGYRVRSQPGVSR